MPSSRFMIHQQCIMVVVLNVTCMSCKKAKKNRRDLIEYIYLDALEACFIGGMGIHVKLP